MAWRAAASIGCNRGAIFRNLLDGEILVRRIVC